MSMNEFLAQVYGTNSEEGVEKTAEAVLLEELEKVAEAEGIDISELDDEDIVDILKEAMAGVTLVDEPEEEKVAAEAAPEDDGLTEEDQEKLAEADYLGRVMAHAFNQELNAIGEAVEKTASAKAQLAEAMTLHLTKEASDDDYIVERAQAILDAAEEALEKQSGDDEALNMAALELLANNGYDVDAIVNALS